MQVTVVSGSGLKGDIIGAPDVYVVLKHAGQVHKTSVETGRDPTWRQTFQMMANTQQRGGFTVGKGTLDVEVYDKDKIGKDDLLGSGSIDLEQLEWNRTTVKVIDLKKGQITMEIKATEFGLGKRIETPPSTGQPPASAPQPSSTPAVQPHPPEQPQQQQQQQPQNQQPQPKPSRAPIFPHYRGPYYSEGDDYENKYYNGRTRSSNEDVEARRTNDVLDSFPVYQGQVEVARTPTSYFRPMRDYPEAPLQRGSHYRGASTYSQSVGPVVPAGPMVPYIAPTANDQMNSSAAAPPPPATKPALPAKKHPDIGTLHITVSKASGLKATSDYAVRLKIEDKKIETTVKKDTQSPQWNESFKFFVRLSPGNQPGVRLGRTATTPLLVTLLDKKANEDLGTATVSLQDLYEGKGTEVQGAQFKDKNGATVGDIALTLKPLAFGLKFFKGKLRCRITKAVDLKGAAGSEPDTFVVMRLRDEKQMTKVIKENRNPEWNEEFSFTPDVFEKKGVVTCTTDLNVEVFSKVGTREEKLGHGAVQLGSLVQKRAQKRTIDLFEGKLYLEVEAENFGVVPTDEPQPTPAATVTPPPPLPSKGSQPATTTTPSPYQGSKEPTFTPQVPQLEEPPLPGYPMPASATVPVFSAGPDGRYDIPGLPPLDPDDATIAALKEELYQLQRQSLELEKKNSEDVVPLQMELNVVRAQLDRANVQIDRLRAPDGYFPMDTFGYRGDEMYGPTDYYPGSAMGHPVDSLTVPREEWQHSNSPIHSRHRSLSPPQHLTVPPEPEYPEDDSSESSHHSHHHEHSPPQSPTHMEGSLRADSPKNSRYGSPKHGRHHSPRGIRPESKPYQYHSPRSKERIPEVPEFHSIPNSRLRNPASSYTVPHPHTSYGGSYVTPHSPPSPLYPRGSKIPYAVTHPTGHSLKHEPLQYRGTLHDRTNHSSYGAFPGAYDPYHVEPSIGMSPPSVRTYSVPTEAGYASQPPIQPQSYYIDPFTGQKVSSLAEVSGFGQPRHPSPTVPSPVKSPRVPKAASHKKPAAHSNKSRIDLYERAAQANRAKLAH